MFSKPLFKQSCKANGMLWAIITAATCIMLAVLVLVMGNSNISQIQDSLGGAITRNVAEAQIERYSMNFYYTLNTSLQQYDTYNGALSGFSGMIFSAYEENLQEETSGSEATDEQKQTAIENTMAEPSLSLIPADYQPIIRSILETYAFGNVSQEQAISIVLQNTIVSAVYDNAYAQTQDETSAALTSGIVQNGLSAYVAQKSTANLDADTFSENFIPTAMTATFSQAFEEYEITSDEIQEISENGITNFQAQIYIKYGADADLTSLNSTEVTTLINSLTESLMDELPDDVSGSLEELGDMDIFALVVGEIFFKIAGILLPMIYIIMTANSLISGQVDSGSMAYTLSTPIKRKSVAFTQMCYLMLSVFAMFVCTTIVGIVCLQFVKPEVATINAGQMALYNLGAFVTLFAISGICFLTSCIFNRSKTSMATGGGISMYFLVATILGLFGAGSFPSMIRIDAMNIFNYTTIISLFDTTSILAGTLTFLWKFAILLTIGIVCFIVGTHVFDKKDLPL